MTPKAGLELAPFARLILRSTIDGARLYFDTVSTNGRSALREALAATKDRAAFLEAARAVDAELDGPARRKFREQLKNYFPDAHVAIVGGVDNASAVVTVDLLAAVHETPAADAPRLVYADKLLEAGDPRGEFIILQCERARSGAEPTLREQELLGLLPEELEWHRLVAVISRQPDLAELSLPVAPPPEILARMRDKLTSLRTIVLPNRRLERGRGFEG